MSESVCLFSSIGFVVSGLTFMSLIHFEFIFVYGIRVYSNFILLHVAVQLSLQHLLKRLFLHFIFLPPCYRLYDHKLRVILWTFYPVPLIYISVFMLVHTVLMTVALQSSLKLERLIPPALFFFLKVSLAIQVLYVFIQIVNFFVLIL